MRKILVVSILTGMVWVMGGCAAGAFLGYQIFAPREKKIKAEYKNLADTTVAIVIASGPAMDFEFPTAKTNMALNMAYYTGKQIKTVKFVDQEKIESYQRDDLDWMRASVAEIGRKFGADRVVYVDLVKFTINEENSINLLRGNVDADLRVYEMDGATPDKPAYQSRVQVFFPENNPIPLSDENTRIIIENQTTALFALNAAQKFYDYKVPIKD